MIIHTNFHRELGDTIQGEKIVVQTIYSSFDAKEIDKLEEMFKESIKSGLRMECTIEDLMKNRKDEN